MKKFYLLLLFLVSYTFYAQTYTAKVSQEDPEKPWLITFTHNDWGFFDPGFDALKVYIFINTSHNTFGQNLWDNWGTFATELVWDDALQARKGTVNLKDYVFNGSGGSLQNGNTLQNFGYIFVRVPNDGSWSQTADLFAAEHGFTPFTLSTLTVNDVSQKSKSAVANGKLVTPIKGNLNLEIYDASGRIIKKLEVQSNGQPINLNFAEKGIFLLKLVSENGSEAIRFRN